MTVESVAAAVSAEREIAKESLIAILPRVDAMNSFIRSEGARRPGLGNSALTRVVYHYKRQALIRATELGMATHRRAQVPAKCRDCGGDGRYMDSCGFTHDHCWRCSNSGYVRLEFVETALPAGIEWLTPRERSWDFMRGTDYAALAETASNPQINQPGKDLTPSEVAAHMNAIEAFFPKRPETYWGYERPWNPYETYTLWVGAMPRDVCYLCGVSMDLRYGGHGVRSGRLEWSACVCKACEHVQPESIFTVLARRFPVEFLTPEIREWVARHPVAETK